MALTVGASWLPLPTALIGDQVPPPLQGVAIGWLRTMTDSGQILGPLVMGAVADAVDLSTPFLLGGGLADGGGVAVRPPGPRAIGVNVRMR
jgi:MFS family permease